MSIKRENFLSAVLMSGLLSLTSLGALAATTTDSSKPTAEPEAKQETPTKEAPADTPSDTAKLPTKQERIEQWGDSNIAVRAGAAAEALKAKKYSLAIPNFRSLIGFDPKNPEFYIGLYYSAAKAESWGQAYLGLEELFEIKPEFKKKFAKQFAQVLRENAEEEEAEEYDKLVTKTSGDGSAYIEKLMSDFVDKSLFVKEKAKLKPEYKPPTRDTVEEDEVHIHRSKYGLTFANMFHRSESIVIAEYKKYESDGLITYFDPPKAIFRIEEYLKGPPLNPYLPIKFEFHNKIGEKKPKGWKFSPDMMPKKGTKWIIFIYNGVPIDGMFETYHGAFGRQEFNEGNYDKILRIIEKHKGQTR